MRKTSLIFVFSACFIFSACAQKENNNNQLLEEATNLLKKNGGNVSDILTDKKYIAIHPHKNFRELVKAHANSEVLSIATGDEPGKKIRVLGKIVNKEGTPVPGALVYLYQTDAKGWYAANSPHVGGNAGDMDQARLFGYVKTDKDGKFELHTVKPAGYPKSNLPAHIHVHVWKEGYQNFVNEFLFDDDERLVGEVRKNSERYNLMIAKAEATAKPHDQQFSYQIVLSK